MSDFEVLNNRELNFLRDSDRNVRKKTLERMKKELISKQQELDEDSYQKLVLQVYKPMLKSLQDSSERCREIATEILHNFATKSPFPEELLSYLIPVFVQRLGNKEMVESSEEVRLLQVQTLNVLLERCKERLAPYLDDLISILSRGILDPYHEIKKEACFCAMKLAVAVPSHFHMQSEQLTKPLLQTLGHQHAKVRGIAVTAIGTVIQYGNNKSIEEVTGPLAQLLFDQSSAVRLAVTIVVGKWMCDLYDRYSYFTKLIPILLTCLMDEVPEVRNEATLLWEKAGKQYETENESTYKDALDFQKAAPMHYPEDVVRPTIGCRILVQRNFFNILPAIINNLSDWVGKARIKAATLLYILLLHVEENATMNLEKLLSKMSEAASDEEKEVVKMINKSAELLGYFIKPDIWISLLLPVIISSPTSGNLLLLSALIKRSNPELLSPELEKLCDALTQSSVCRTFQIQEQAHLLSCTENMLCINNDKISKINFSIFTVLLTVDSLTKSEDHKKRVHKAMINLAVASDLKSKEDLYNLHSEYIIGQLQETHEIWEVHSPEFLMFVNLLTHTGKELGDLLEKIMPFLIINMNPKKDPELRLKLFTVLSTLMVQSNRNLNSSGSLHTIISSMISDIILPNLVWHAGRTAKALRTACVSFLWTILCNIQLGNNIIEPVADQLFCSLVSLMEDDSSNTRLVTCKVFQKIIPALFEYVNSEKLYNLYPVFLKRMDDMSDEIRIAVTYLFSAYFESFSGNYDTILYIKHLEAIYCGLLLHMDDTNSKVQQAVLDLLVQIAPLQPNILLEEVEKVKSRHRTQTFCRALIDHIHSLKFKE